MAAVVSIRRNGSRSISFLVHIILTFLQVNLATRDMFIFDCDDNEARRYFLRF